MLIFNILFLSSTNQDVGDTNDDDEDDYEDLALSEVTTCASSDDASGCWMFEWNLERSLSPEWELENCETDIQPR